MDQTQSQKKSKKRVQPQKIVQEQLQQDQNVDSKKKIKITESKSKSIIKSAKKSVKKNESPLKFPSLDLEPEQFLSEVDDSKIQKLTDKLEKINVLLQEKKHNLFIKDSQKQIINMNSEQFLTLLEEQTLIIHENQEINSSKDECIVTKTVHYQNNLFHQDAYFNLETKTLHPHGKQEQCQWDNEQCDEEEEQLAGGVRLVFVDESDKQIVIYEEENDDELIEEFDIKEKQLQQVFYKKLMVDYSKNKNIENQSIIDGMIDYFVDRISENFPCNISY